MMLREPLGRKFSEIRPLKIETHVTRYAEGSALIRAGHTHVLCTATVEENVPGWLAGKGRGWVSAEYSMLPRSTHSRVKRERGQVSGRTQEIQRLIGRALRSMVDLKQLGERSILVDCDVIQADGGTRTASITGGCVALAMALGRLTREGKIPALVFSDTVAAVSIGVMKQSILIDLDYNEDSQCEVDMNFVITGKEGLVEVQGTGEQNTFSKQDLLLMTDCAFEATRKIRVIQLEAIETAQKRSPQKNSETNSE